MIRKQTNRLLEEGDIIEVIWADATANSKVPLKFLNKKERLEDLLTYNTSYGKLFLINKKMIIILTEHYDIKAEVLAIPKSWTIKINLLRKGKK